jgi:hypothetical protein
MEGLFMNFKLIYKNSIFIMIFCIFTGGCALDDSDDQKSNMGSDNVDKENSTNDTANIFSKYVQMIGMTDAEVVKLLGEGVRAIPENHTNIITREYLFTLDNNNLIAIVSYNDDGIVHGVYCYLPDYESDKWEALLTKELGTPTRINDPSMKSEDGNDTIYISWMLDSIVISLFGSNGSLSIQIE